MISLYKNKLGKSRRTNPALWSWHRNNYIRLFCKFIHIFPNLMSKLWNFCLVVTYYPPLLLAVVPSVMLVHFVVPEEPRNVPLGSAAGEVAQETNKMDGNEYLSFGSWELGQRS
jgi:hypothetical protein